MLQGQTLAKNFTQRFGVDYKKTFALVAKFVSIRCILVLAAIKTWRFIKNVKTNVGRISYFYDTPWV